MSTSTNAILGTLFLILSIVATALMYQYWGYPFDKEKNKSECPQWKMNIHRAVGFAYVAIYVLLMIQMVPRLWTYQVEFPPRTVAHVMLGITIGVLLLVKVSIIRFWRHFERWMPVLGTLVMLCTFLLTGLSLPFAFQERALSASAAGGNAFSVDNQERVERLLPAADLPSDLALSTLASEEGLRAGREVLLNKCVTCHDLKTILSGPRSPSGWFRTVLRMSEKPTLGQPLEEMDLYRVTAFLVAITPDLQKSLKAKRAVEERRAKLQLSLESESAQAASEGMDAGDSPMADIELEAARAVFERVCSECHDSSDIEYETPTSKEEVLKLIERMIENDLTAEPEELKAVQRYLTATYVKQ